MSRSKDLRRQLDRVCDAIDGIDGELSAGRLTSDEHARRRGELEREAGDLYVRWRRAQRERGESDAVAAAPSGRRTERPERAAPAAATWYGRPIVWGLGGFVMLVLGVVTGVVVGRGVTGSSPGTMPASARSDSAAAIPADAPSSGMSEADLRALRDIAAREDAPTSGLLQFAHVALDQGKLAEARRTYERVLAREPRNVEALTHIGAVLYQEGRVEDALAKVDEALAIDSRYIHALWDRMQYLYQAKRDDRATAQAAEAFLKVVPEGPDADTAKRLLDDVRRLAQKAPLPTKSR